MGVITKVSIGKPNDFYPAVLKVEFADHVWNFAIEDNSRSEIRVAVKTAVEIFKREMFEAVKNQLGMDLK